jgi:hypothetical protein
MLLLAEMEFSLTAGLALSVGTILLTIGGTWALNKYKVEAALKKVDDNSTADEEREKTVAGELKQLREQMQASANANRESARDLEKTMIRRLDDVKGTVSEIDKKMSVMESEVDHLKRDHRDMKKKVTLFGRSSKMRGFDPDDTMSG